MPYYLNLLREASIISIFILFAEVLLLTIFKGKIKDKNIQIFAYIWLPFAVISQFLMTYFRSNLGISNLPVMNIYLMIELIILSLLIYKIREKIKGKPINYKIWFATILIGIIIHFTYELDSIHNAAILYTAIVYFNLSISFIEIEKLAQFYKDFYLLLNLGVFVKAFGYSYFTIYQIDYKFPLAVYSIVNLFTQIIFFVTILIYYNSIKNKTKNQNIN